MSPRTEYDAAYFTMLRAIEERDALLRYRDFLHDERDRLDTFAVATRESGSALPRRVRRTVERTDRPLLEAVGRRRTVLLEELSRIDDRVAAAEAFVTECEEEVADLRH